MEYRYPEKNELSERKLQELSSDTRSSAPTEGFDQNPKDNKLDEIADLNSSFEDQPAERTEHEYPEKAELLENIIHALGTDTRSSAPTEGFDQNPKENRLNEITGLNNSFEDQPAERTEHEHPEKAELFESIIHALGTDTRSSAPTEGFGHNPKENRLNEITGLNNSFEDQAAEKTEHGYPEKTALSESIIHERTSDTNSSVPIEGYDQHPKDNKLNEVFGLKNSFDDISVGMDEKNTMTIAVRSQKEPYGPTLNSDRKRLKGPRKRILYEHFGEFYTNPSAPLSSAYAYKARRELSENRMMSEMRRTSDRRLSPEQREMAPFLTLEEDREELNELRGKQDESQEAKEEKGRLERSILRKTEMENRFLRKLRLARLSRMNPKDVKKPAYDLQFNLIPEQPETDDKPDDNEDNNKNNNNINTIPYENDQ